MPAKSLFELATATCVKNLRGLESIGDFLPYEAVRHILLKIESAPQLRQIELNSPQIKGQTGEIWLKLIERDFPLEYKNKAYKPQDPDHWYRVWEKYKKDHDRAIQESEDKLKNALLGLRQDKEKNTSRIIERKLLPKTLKLASGKKLYSGHRDAHSNALTFNSGSRTKTNTGASVMRRVRREVREIATIHGSLSKPIRVPIRQSQQSQLQSAPAAMVNDYRRAAQPQYRSTAVLSPEAQSALAEHEERATFISDSEDNDHGDDVFDDDEMPRAPSKSIAKPRPTMHVPSSSLPNKTLASSSQATPSTSRASTPSTASSPAKKVSKGLLSNRFKGGMGKGAAKSSSSSSSGPPPPAPSTNTTTKTTKTVAAAKSARQFEAAKTPQDAAPARASPPPAVESAAIPALSSESIPRKRKTVDIFMRRPNKRVG
ncbi:hypothetical protein E4U42_000248 [Claviceps africana]|uniref:Elongin-A n=1 Tax=Claviceps africana TaxID=83212 RepID=A0A8K0NKK7_9HYPO|nr:hypothetical protein E4U42_000248 [Claviceps africana]